MLSPAAYDSGLYYFNSIRWLNEYPIIPGLGNLHGRLAFNQSFFTYVASLNFYPVLNHGHNLANSFVSLLFLAELLFNFFLYIGDRRPINGGGPAVVALFFLPFGAYVASRPQMSSPTPDLASSILQVILFIYMFRFVTAQSSDSNHARLRFILLLAATLITVKLSNAVYALAILGVCGYHMTRAAGFRESFTRNWDLKSAVTFALILIVWMTRGILLSGYPAYPATLGRMSFDWAVPVAEARETANWIYSWARQPNADPAVVLGSWTWLTPWWRMMIENQLWEQLYPGAAALVIACVGACYTWLKKDAVVVTRLALLPPLMALLFWFWTAPDPRFAQAFFVVLAAASCLTFIGGDPLRVFLAILIVNAGLIIILVKNPWVLKMVSTVGYMPISSSQLHEQRTQTGLKVYLPARGDQCWDSPLPCTPYLNPKLRLRGDRVQSGFTLTDRCSPGLCPL